MSTDKSIDNEALEEGNIWLTRYLNWSRQDGDIHNAIELTEIEEYSASRSSTLFSPMSRNELNNDFQDSTDMSQTEGKVESNTVRLEDRSKNPFEILNRIVDRTKTTEAHTKSKTSSFSTLIPETNLPPLGRSMSLASPHASIELKRSDTNESVLSSLPSTQWKSRPASTLSQDDDIPLSILRGQRLTGDLTETSDRQMTSTLLKSEKGQLPSDDEYSAMYRLAQKHYSRFFSIEVEECDSILKSHYPELYSETATPADSKTVHEWHKCFRRWVSSWQGAILRSFSTFVARLIPILGCLSDDALLRRFHHNATKENIAMTFFTLRKTLDHEKVLDSKAGDLYTTLFAHLCRDTYYHLMNLENPLQLSKQRYRQLDTIKRLPRDPSFKDITVDCLPVPKDGGIRGTFDKKRKWAGTTMAHVDPGFKRLSVIQKQ